jgi:hypothetical protein
MEDFKGWFSWQECVEALQEEISRLQEEQRGQNVYIRENQKLISALERRLSSLEDLISSSNGDLPPIELVFEGGRWITMDDFLKRKGDN